MNGPFAVDPEKQRNDRAVVDDPLHFSLGNVGQAQAFGIIKEFFFLFLVFTVWVTVELK